MGPKRNTKRAAAADEAAPSPDNKKQKVLDEETVELLDQVSTLLQQFFRVSLNWTGGDDDLEFKRSKPTLVKGKSFSDTHPDREDELLVIVRKDEEPFTAEFIELLRPKLVTIVNAIIEANNTWLVATNYHEAHLTQEDAENFLKIFLNPEVTEDCNPEDDDESGVREGAIGFRRPSGNAVGRWDYTCNTTAAEEETIESYSSLPKGSHVPLTLIAE
jgi:hypothetical protein